ncbi:biotin/lipoyl-containing protein [Bacteroidota bacterium]
MAIQSKASAPKPKTSPRESEQKVESPVSAEENGENGNGKMRCKSLIIDGTKYRTQLNKKFENRKAYESPDPRKVTSSIPGTIVKVNVKEGQEVREGDQMLILEAMKMKNIIIFHTGGRVKKIHVSEGEKISKDFLMLELN